MERVELNRVYDALKASIDLWNNGETSLYSKDTTTADFGR